MLDEAAIAKIARLARIRLSAEELPHYARELSGMLKFVEQLSEVNTDGVPMLASVSGMTLPRREDRVTDGGQPQAVLANAPKSGHGCFSVPKVIE